MLYYLSNGKCLTMQFIDIIAYRHSAYQINKKV